MRVLGMAWAWTVATPLLSAVMVVMTPAEAGTPAAAMKNWAHAAWTASASRSQQRSAGMARARSMGLAQTVMMTSSSAAMTTILRMTPMIQSMIMRPIRFVTASHARVGVAPLEAETLVTWRRWELWL